MNLVTNAAQAGCNCAGHIDVRISTRDLTPGESRLRPGRYALLEVIDDSPGVLDVVSELLGALGYTVTGFLDADSALQHFRNHPEDYDLVMTDQRMPAMSGVELAEAVHQQAPQTPVILLTGYDDGIILNPHVADVIQKPASLALLKQVVGRVLSPVQVMD